MRRSGEPLRWLLFGAGGMLAALAGPALVLYTGVLTPIAEERGWILLEPEAVRASLGTGWAAAATVLILALLLLHAAHRLAHTVQDLGLAGQRGALRLFYGIAAGGSLVAAGAVIAI